MTLARETVEAIERALGINVAVAKYDVAQHWCVGESQRDIDRANAALKTAERIQADWHQWKGIGGEGKHGQE